MPAVPSASLEIVVDDEASANATLDRWYELAITGVSSGPGEARKPLSTTFVVNDQRVVEDPPKKNARRKDQCFTCNETVDFRRPNDQKGHRCKGVGGAVVVMFKTKKTNKAQGFRWANIELALSWMKLQATRDSKFNELWARLTEHAIALYEHKMEFISIQHLMKLRELQLLKEGVLDPATPTDWASAGGARIVIDLRENDSIKRGILQWSQLLMKEKSTSAATPVDLVTTLVVNDQAMAIDGSACYCMTCQQVVDFQPSETTSGHRECKVPAVIVIFRQNTSTLADIKFVLWKIKTFIASDNPEERPAFSKMWELLSEHAVALHKQDNRFIDLSLLRKLHKRDLLESNALQRLDPAELAEIQAPTSETVQDDADEDETDEIESLSDHDDGVSADAAAEVVKDSDKSSLLPSEKLHVSS